MLTLTPPRALLLVLASIALLTMLANATNARSTEGFTKKPATKKTSKVTKAPAKRPPPPPPKTKVTKLPAKLVKPACGVPEGEVAQCPGSPTTYVMRGGKLLQHSYDSWVAEGGKAPFVVSCKQLLSCPKGGMVPYSKPASPVVGRTWSNIICNRFGDYGAYGQGRGTISTVTCATQLGTSAPPGLWTALNPVAFGLPAVPCGMRLRIFNPATGASVDVTVVDGGGSNGLDLDDQAYRALFGPTADGIQFSQPVVVQELIG